MFLRYRSKVLTGVVVLIAAALHGCTRGNVGPVETLREYVSRSMSVTKASDIERLQELSTGSVREQLEKTKTDPEMFRKAFLEEKRKFVAVRVRDERVLGDDRYSLTYEIAYSQESPEEKASGVDKVTTKKHAILVRAEGKWLVSEVQTIKTYIDRGTEEKITATPGVK